MIEHGKKKGKEKLRGKIIKIVMRSLNTQSGVIEAW
jgi:hypothetical protein